MKIDKATLNKLQEEMTEKTREIWLAGLGVFSAAEEQGSKLFKDFVEKGEEMVKKGEKLEKKGLQFSGEKKKEIAGKVDEVSSYLEEKLNSAMAAVGISTRNEVKELSDKVDRLADSVAALADKLGAEQPQKKSK